MAKKFNELFNKMSPARQARINAKVKNTLKEMSLAEIRELHQVTQENIATILQIKQSSVSRMEQRSNVTVERLRDYAHALGG
ncbi:MAG TPA: transcriptional regulator, partial [Deltaproteobacteria bacterium]|nr:transcriptional regulator [Deltaproteobacteria bacterium]